MAPPRFPPHTFVARATTSTASGRTTLRCAASPRRCCATGPTRRCGTFRRRLVRLPGHRCRHLRRVHLLPLRPTRLRRGTGVRHGAGHGGGAVRLAETTKATALLVGRARGEPRRAPKSGSRRPPKTIGVFVMEGKTARSGFLAWCTLFGCDPANLPSSTCICGHVFEDHRPQIPTDCVHGVDDTHPEGCECSAFFPGGR